jgi:uncharacterized protein (DUF433 family)/uncharacterized protein with HEPN domain
MRRDQLFLAEMIDPAEQAHRLAGETSVEDLSKDRQRRDALMWNFTVLGEASTQVSDGLKSRFGDVGWEQPAWFAHRVVHGYWRALGAPSGRNSAAHCRRAAILIPWPGRSGGWAVGQSYAGGMVFTRITVDPALMGGVPTIRGLRIPVATVVSMVADGMTPEEICRDLPDLTPQDVAESLWYAAETVVDRRPL